MNERIARKGSLDAMLEEYYLNNPDEDLTIADAAIKFNRSVKSIYTALQKANGSRVYEYVRVIRRRRHAPSSES